MSETTVETVPKVPAPPGTKRKGPGKPTNQLPGTQGFISAQPTSGADLIALWELPPLAYREGRLKVSRRIQPTLELELLADLLVGEYDLAILARDFGPGQFFLLLSADPQKRWGVHNAKVSVSPQYAAGVGYQTYRDQAPLPSQYALPRISEVNALQSAATALASDRPLTVRDLAQLMEMMADKTADALSRRQQPGPQLQGDPMNFFQACLTMQQTMEDRAFKVAERLMTGRITEPAEPTEPSFAGEMMKLIPTLLAAFKPAPGQAPPVQQQPTYQNPPQAIQEPPMPDPEPIPIPLSREEAERFSLAIGMLRPWVRGIIDGLAAEPDTLKVAQEFERFIPPVLEGQLQDLNRLTQERGPAVLALISPELATPRGADLVSKIVTIISSE